MKTSNTQKFSLGLFIFIATIIFVFALYLIGNKQNLFGNTFRISAVFNNVNGLILGDNVRFSGINIGTVKNIVMINDSTICVDMTIEDKMLKHLKKNAVAAVGFAFPDRVGIGQHAFTLVLRFFEANAGDVLQAVLQ